ncbi:MAG: permease prefix domain 1-containing protein [Chloroflexota bacterium]
MNDIEELLDQIRLELELDKETEQDVLDELRDHLQEIVAAAMAAGASRQEALAQAATRFGLGQEVGRALQAAHAGWATADAVIAAGLPVLLALALRWLVFAPDGTTIGWQQVLVRPAFWAVAMAALLVPLLKLERWRYALISWGLFWTMTIVFVLASAIRW